jgi:hypothetical protein
MYSRSVLTVLAAGAAAALIAAPTAGAAPDCSPTSQATTQCERAGNVQIVTGPTTYSETGPFFEYPWGTGGIGVPILGKGGV